MAGALILAVVAVGYLLMWRGWRRRAAAHDDLPPLPRPLPGEVAFGPVEVTYAGTTEAGDWLARVVAHSLGRRGRAAFDVRDTGVTIARAPEPDLHVPTGQVRAVRVDRAGAGKATRRPEQLIITWEHGSRMLDTALRPRRHDDLESMRAAVASLTPEGATP